MKVPSGKGNDIRSTVQSSVFNLHPQYGYITHGNIEDRLNVPITIIYSNMQ